jgi:hypothetical protein
MKEEITSTGQSEINCWYSSAKSNERLWSPLWENLNGILLASSLLTPFSLNRWMKKTEIPPL